MIFGRVSNNNGKPLAAASITWVKQAANASPLSTVLSGTDGAYRIEAGLGNTYKLSVSYAGFHTQDTTITFQGDIKIDFTLSPKVVELGTVTVNSKKELMVKKMDRIVFNVDGISLYQNKSVTDILKNIPRLNVTRSSIEIKGSGPAAVMIDDRIIYLTSKDLLDYLNIFKDDIASIEVITNPPAKYDAQGAGLINIVTKKKKALGLFGYLEAGMTKNSYLIADQTVSLGYRNKNFSLITSLGNSFGAYQEYTRASSLFTDPGKTSWQDEAENKNQLNSQRFNMVAEWLLSRQTKLYSSYSIALSQNNTGKNHRIEYPGETAVDSAGITTGLNTDRGYTHIANLGISSTFGKKNNALSGTVDYVNKSNTSVNNSTTYNYFSDLSAPTGTRYEQYNYGDIPKNVISGKLDLSFPGLVQQVDLETGIKFTVFNNDSETDYNQLTNGRSIYDGVVTRNNFAYREQNMAAYISANRESTKWSIKGGLRYERTVTRGTSDQLQTYNTFNNLFPSLFIQYKVSSGTSIDAAYTRRIVRPTLFDVNPFKVYTSIFSSYVGNPYLFPSLQDNYNFNFVLKSNYILSAFYNITHRPIVSFPINTTDNIIESKKLNEGKLSNYGLNFDAGFTITSQWRSSFSLSFSSYRYYTDYVYNIGKRPLNVSLSTRQSVQFSSTLSADLSFSATLPGAYNISTQKGYSSLDLGLTKALLKNRLVVSLASQDILRSNSQSATTVTSTFRTTNYNYYDFRQVALTVRFKFGKELKVVKKKANIQEVRRM